MIAQQAAQHYLNQPNNYPIRETRKQFGGSIILVEGKPYIVFPDETTLSIQKIVKAKFEKKGKYEG